MQSGRLATGDNDYFFLEAKEIASRGLPMEAFRPILPSPRYLTDNEIIADRNGVPLLDRQLFLLDTRLPEDEIGKRLPVLFAYLQDGKSRSIHQRYLCQHRAPWYAQENRPPAPIVCTYLGRGDAKNGRPFRFILNNSKATVANVYLAMYPTTSLARALERDISLIRRVWEMLNKITPDRLLGEGEPRPRAFGHIAYHGSRTSAAPRVRLQSEPPSPNRPSLRLCRRFGSPIMYEADR